MKKGKNLARRLYSKKTIKKMEEKISLLGIYCNYNAAKLLNRRLFFSCFIFLFSLFYFKYGYIISPILTLAFYYLYEYIVLDIPIKKRSIKLEEEAIFFFEILSLTLEGGKNLPSALDVTAANVSGELSEEFKKSLAEIKLGKSFSESINNMKKRIPSDAINNALLNITQSNLFGNDISESLNNQLNYLREKRLLEIKAEMTKLPTKISVLSVLFFIPIMLLVILSPILLDLLFG